MTTNQKRYFISEFTLFQNHRSYSISFNLSKNVGQIFWGCTRKDRIFKFRKRTRKFCFVFIYSIRRARDIRNFYIAVVQRRLRNVQKSQMHVQNCCFADLNLMLFCHSRCRGHRRCLSSLLLWSRNFGTMVTWRHISPLCWDQSRRHRNLKNVFFLCYHNE